MGCRVIGILATFASNILAARLLGPAEFGVYLFLSSVAGAGSLIGSAGLSNASLRFSSESLALGRRSLAVAYVYRTTTLCVVTTVLAGGLTAAGLFAFHLATGRLSDPALLVVLTVLMLAALAGQQLAGETLRGWNNLKLASLFSGGVTGGPVSNVLFSAGIIGLLMLHVSMTAAGVLGLLAASVWLTVPFALWSVWRMIHRDPAHSSEPRVALTSVEDRQMLAMAVTVFMLHLLTFVVNQLDIWIGEALLPPNELGVYGVAKRCMLLAAMPVQMAMLTIAGTIPRLHAQGRRRELQDLMRGSAGVAAVPALAALSLLVLSPGFVVDLLFGSSYSGAATSIRILAVGHLVLVAAGNPFAMLSLNGRHNTVLPVSLVAVGFLAVAGPLAAFWYGASGLAWVSTGALVIQSALLWWLAYLRSGIWTHMGLPRRHAAGDPPIEAQTAATFVEPARTTTARTRPCEPMTVEVGADFSNDPEDL